MLKDIEKTLESLGELSDDERVSFLGTINMFHFLSNQADAHSEKMEEYIGGEIEALEKSFDPTVMVQSKKNYIDSNLFVKIEKDLLTPEIKTNFKDIPDLQKGWPIIEYSCDVFKGLPGEIPNKTEWKRLSRNYFKYGWDLLTLVWKNVKSKESEMKKLRGALAYSCCYCGRIKRVSDLFEAEHEQIIFSQLC